MGAQAVTRALVGTGCPPATVSETRSQVISMIKEKVAPEFINRIDDIVMFLPLGIEQIEKIVRLQTDRLRNRMLASEMDIRIGEEAIACLTQMSYQPEYGARPVKRVINDYLVNEITMRLLSGEITRDRPILVGASDGCLTVRNENN